MQLVIRNKMLLCTSTLDVGWWYSKLAEVVNGEFIGQRFKGTDTQIDLRCRLAYMVIGLLARV